MSLDKQKQGRGGPKPFIDPNDKLAFFKDNIIDPEEEDQFDPNAYYYNRQEKEVSGPVALTHAQQSKHTFTGGQPGYEQHAAGFYPQHHPGNLHHSGGYPRGPPGGYSQLQNVRQPNRLSMSGGYGPAAEPHGLPADANKWRSASTPPMGHQSYAPSEQLVALSMGDHSFQDHGRHQTHLHQTEEQHQVQMQQQQQLQEKQRYQEQLSQAHAAQQQKSLQQQPGQLKLDQMGRRPVDESAQAPNYPGYGYPGSQDPNTTDSRTDLEVQNTNIDSSFGKPGAIRESIALNLDPQFQSPNERQNREILGVEGGMGSEYMVPEGMMSSAGVLDNSDPYGLLGLLRVLNMTNRDLNTLASGIDLTTLGLNLSSSDVLYSTFASPFSDTPLRRDAQFQIPQCYFIQPPLPPPVDKMSLFSDETLFYIFYSMPQDALQVAAANELLVRDWSYHTELKLWFQRAPGTVPMVKTMSYETGSYVYFDVRHWREMQRVNFHMEYDKLYNPTHG